MNRPRRDGSELAGCCVGTALVSAVLAVGTLGWSLWCSFFGPSQGRVWGAVGGAVVLILGLGTQAGRDFPKESSRLHRAALVLARVAILGGIAAIANATIQGGTAPGAAFERADAYFLQHRSTHVSVSRAMYMVQASLQAIAWHCGWLAAALIVIEELNRRLEAYERRAR